jgi:translation elongation factor EF-G
MDGAMIFVRGSGSMDGNATLINAMAHLASMFGYLAGLRATTGGLASATIQFDHYAPVDPRLLTMSSLLPLESEREGLPYQRRV